MLKWIGVLDGGEAGLVSGQCGRYRVVSFGKLAAAGSADLGNDDDPHIVLVSKRVEGNRELYTVIPQDAGSKFRCDISPEGYGIAMDLVPFAEFSRELRGGSGWTVRLDDGAVPDIIVSAGP